MRTNKASWQTNFRHAVVLLVLSATSLGAADKAPDTSTDQRSFDATEKYLSERKEALQRSTNEKQLVRRWYTGNVRVWDVVEDGNDVVVNGAAGAGVNYTLHFSVQDAALKEKAGQIRKQGRVTITARLDNFSTQLSGYINVPNIEVAEFTPVRVMESQSTIGSRKVSWTRA